MYDIAHSVQACIRANTAVHVAWLVEGLAGDPSAAVALTPGGGRMGNLLDGAIDHFVSDALSNIGESGGVIRISIDTVESLVTGLPEGTELTVAIAPGSAVPAEVWDLAAGRGPLRFAMELDGDRFSGSRLLEPTGESRVVLSEDQLITSLSPVPRVVVSGSGQIAQALSEVFTAAGWRADVFADVGSATGVMATLSPIDAIIVMGHDVETSSRALQGAIESNAGYIGSIGAPHMQQLREDWLSYRGLSWDERVHGPAGLPIEASSPGEIAVSIVAEAIFTLRSTDPGPGPFT